MKKTSMKMRIKYIKMIFYFILHLNCIFIGVEIEKLKKKNR